MGPLSLRYAGHVKIKLGWVKVTGKCLLISLAGLEPVMVSRIIALPSIKAAGRLPS